MNRTSLKPNDLGGCPIISQKMFSNFLHTFLPHREEYINSSIQIDIEEKSEPHPILIMANNMVGFFGSDPDTTI